MSGHDTRTRDGTTLRPVISVSVSRLEGRVEVRLSGHQEPDLIASQMEDGAWNIEGSTPELSEAELAELLTQLCEACARSNPPRLIWWARRAGPISDRAAAAVGMHCDREVQQLRRSLPISAGTEIRTRPFRPGADDAAWLEVNNAAFDWHEDQGGWSHDDLRERMAEPWFDPAGFLIHERDGRIAGFCWTKVHADETPPLGEIYVIGVDPGSQGHGLGRALTLAGLGHLAGRGITAAMLFVEADNERAQRLYRDLGFRLHHTERRYVATAQPPDSTPRSDPTP